MTSIKCGQCGHDNDLTRVFCQNCGARLERAEGTGPNIAAPTQVPTERPAITKRKKEAGSRGAKKFLGFLISIVFTVLISAAFALIIEVARQPDGIPVAKTGDETQASRLYQALKTFSESTFPRALDVKQEQVNNYLACRLVPGAADTDAASSTKAKFVRAFVVIGDGKLRYYVEEQLLGQSLFMYLEYEPTVVNKIITLRETGGGIGHIQFKDPFLPLLDRLVSPVARSAVGVSDVVQSMNGLDLKPTVATLRWSGTPKPAGP